MEKIKVKWILADTPEMAGLVYCMNTLTGCIIESYVDTGESMTESMVFVPGEHYDDESNSFVLIEKATKKGDDKS
jgi:hypothetical protein